MISASSLSCARRHSLAALLGASSRAMTAEAWWFGELAARRCMPVVLFGSQHGLSGPACCASITAPVNAAATPNGTRGSACGCAYARAHLFQGRVAVGADEDVELLFLTITIVPHRSAPAARASARRRGTPGRPAPPHGAAAAHLDEGPRLSLEALLKGGQWVRTKGCGQRGHGCRLKGFGCPGKAGGATEQASAPAGAAEQTAPIRERCSSAIRCWRVVQPS